ncbi:hypothetical protein C8J47_3729 [Sphingomonas sp. PP-F2F-G114-C0414]|uniref:alpha/beta hydrolase family protein n=1 Tax=Sphingomonas sp. PP-F2F-G114-C0414 TaxID=2135662 RepID=UPI000EF8F0A1|nr:alpha/beta hydrolase [Sphingomonas sp. PP-F2F-G114-C0414]RMB25777.1 hypothetical protein C8J47_3729 [Sphingomonas sp. PP-F2F-G114-C0414]
MMTAILFATSTLGMAGQIPARSAPQTTTVAASNAIVGDWQGAIVPAPGRSIPLILHISGTPGSLTATLDSPAQGAVGLPVASVKQEGRTLHLMLTTPSASYTAILSDDGRTLEGTWSQGGGSIPLTMTRATTRTAPAKTSGTARPQTPRPPFPYRVEEVAYDNAIGGSHLAGTLTLPANKGPFPAVLLITGSGLQDRDETLFGHKPFLVWADALTRRGIAVLRVDDRQTGGSTGDVRSATTADFAGDVEAGLAFLRSRRDVDASRIGLIGHSDGGIIAPIVADRDPALAFIVLLSSPGEPLEQVLLSQKRWLETAAGVPKATVDQSAATMQRLYDAVKGAPDQQSADSRLAAAWHSIAQHGGKRDGERGGRRDDAAAPAPVPIGLRTIAQPWMRWFLSYDPRPALEEVRCPVLALGGSKDVQVSASRNLADIKAALHDNPDATTIEVPGLNHLLQTAPTGNVSEYATIEETVSPIALKTVGDWIVDRTKRARGRPKLG